MGGHRTNMGDDDFGDIEVQDGGEAQSQEVQAAADKSIEQQKIAGQLQDNVHAAAAADGEDLQQTEGAVAEAEKTTEDTQDTTVSAKSHDDSTKCCCVVS